MFERPASAHANTSALLVKNVSRGLPAPAGSNEAATRVEAVREAAQGTSEGMRSVISGSTTWPSVEDKPTVEWALPYPGQPLAQGDVLRASTADTTSLSYLYFVMTADCDLANKKHHGRLLCVPIVSLRDFVANFKVALDVDRHRALLADDVVKQVQAFRTKQGGGQLTPARAAEWVGETAADDVLLALGVDRDCTDAVRFRMLCSLFKERVPPALESQIYWLQQCREYLDPKAKPDAGVSLAVQRTRDLLSSPPRDVHLLAEVSPDDREGYVLALRFAEQISDEDISLTPGATDSEYRRVARIRSPYVYSIAQQFGTVFTAVGLPNNHHESVKLSGELLIESFAETKGKL